MADIKVNLGRKISLENAQAIGHGYCSDVYRIDPETVVKVLKSEDFKDAEREILLSKWALTGGIPTAISYDVVDIDGHPGLVYELLGKGSLRDRLINHSEEFDMRMRQYAKLMRDIHAVSDDEARLPKASDTFKAKLNTLTYVTESERDRMRALLDTIPDAKTVVHCDCHIKNIKIVDDELMLIDLDTLSRGDPIFELAAVYCTYHVFHVAQGLTGTDHFFNIPVAFEDRILDSLFRLYFPDLNEAELEENIGKIELLAYLQMLIFIAQSDEKEAYNPPKIQELFRERLAKTDNLWLKYR